MRPYLKTSKQKTLQHTLGIPCPSWGWEGATEWAGKGECLSDCLERYECVLKQSLYTLSPLKDTAL